jgi:hypothetical protein
VLDSGSSVINIEESKRSRAASNCLVGVGVYGGFVVLSIICILLPRFLQKKDQESIPLTSARDHHNEI